MEIEFKDLGMMIASNGGGLCYELFEWNDGGKEWTVRRGEDAGKTVLTEAGWRSMGRYPSSIENAVQQVYEFAILRGATVTHNDDELLSQLTQIRDSIISALPKTVPALTGEVR